MQQLALYLWIDQHFPLTEITDKIPKIILLHKAYFTVHLVFWIAATCTHMRQYVHSMCVCECVCLPAVSIDALHTWTYCVSIHVYAAPPAYKAVPQTPCLRVPVCACCCLFLPARLKILSLSLTMSMRRNSMRNNKLLLSSGNLHLALALSLGSWCIDWG